MDYRGQRRSHETRGAETEQDRRPGGPAGVWASCTHAHIHSHIMHTCAHTCTHMHAHARTPVRTQEPRGEVVEGLSVGATERGSHPLSGW